MELEAIDLEGRVLDLYPDGTASSRRTRPGPPERVAGLTLGVVDLVDDAPHGGEMHPDGDEVLIVLSGRMRVTCDAAERDLILGPGQACIVPKGEWHRLYVLEPTRLVHVTPGPDGDHRPLP
jgi:mannose-6-phosphate isomerase-like protein (cupin superfamily)